MKNKPDSHHRRHLQVWETNPSEVFLLPKIDLSTGNDFSNMVDATLI